MRAIIDSINIYDANNNHRNVTFTSGVNVITGDSKTGKSALLEIVDFCLFSKTSSIPKGVITNFAIFYAIVLKTEAGSLVIGRPAPKTGKSANSYFKFEPDIDKVSPLNKKYFETLSPMTLKSAQEKFETHLGLSVNDLNSDYNGFNLGKASIRNATSFLFQHQNLIANKHALFYRFHDFVKRERTIKELPVLLGWVNGDYYRLIRELDDNEKKIKSYIRLAEHNEKYRETNKNNIITLMDDYLSLIDFKLSDNIDYHEVLKLSKSLPPIPENPLPSSEYEKEYYKASDRLAELITQLSIITKKISSFENSADLSIEHAKKLRVLEKRFTLLNISDQISCPLCNTRKTDINDKLLSISNSQNNLLSEISKLSDFYQDSSFEIDNLRQERTQIKNQITLVSSKLKEFEKNKKELTLLKSQREKASFIKGKVETLLSVYNRNNNIINKNEELDELKKRNQVIRMSLAKYNIDEHYKKTESLLSQLMTKICKKLDFEDELKPANLFFSLRTFDFYHTHNGEKIKLHEMGSGANWLACHLSLFLGMLYIITKEKKSHIPTFLFLDQPSQVYFPSGKKQSELKDSDIKQVENIFNVITMVIRGIKAKFDFEPQIIILEHADNLDLDEDFESLVRKRWKENGEKLI